MTYVYTKNQLVHKPADTGPFALHAPLINWLLNISKGQNSKGGSRPKYLGPVPYPSPPITSLSLFFPSHLSSSAFPLEVGFLKYSYGVWGSAVSSPSGVWGGAPAEIEFCAL